MQYERMQSNAGEAMQWTILWCDAQHSRAKHANAIQSKAFFPRARAKGSCLVRLPLEAWIELRRMPDRARTIEKSIENKWFFNIFNRAKVGPKSTQSRTKVG